jgi:membrane protein DedA with SNARE-associated domain
MTMNELLLQIKPWIEWMHLHPYWVGWITFAISFFECVALIGFFVPGAVLITAVSSLVGSGMVPLSVVLIPAIIGAILGDALSFGLGYYYRDHLRDIWPFKYYPHLLQKGESFFYRHGGISILIARFIGPVRHVSRPVCGGKCYFCCRMGAALYAAGNFVR